MVDQKRRTEIQIETHEITIIRFGKVENVGTIEKLLEQADVIAHGDVDPVEEEETQGKGDSK